MLLPLQLRPRMALPRQRRPRLFCPRSCRRSTLTASRPAMRRNQKRPRRQSAARLRKPSRRRTRLPASRLPAIGRPKRRKALAATAASLPPRLLLSPVPIPSRGGTRKMAVLSARSRRDMEIHRYPAPLYVVVPIFALVLQALLPRFMGRYMWFDLPLVVTIYFALGRRSPIQGMFMGAFVGLFEDALTHHAIGINGIAKTVAGYLAASVGIRIVVENNAIRVMLNFVLS